MKSFFLFLLLSINICIYHSCYSYQPILKSDAQSSVGKTNSKTHKKSKKKQQTLSVEESIKQMKVNSLYKVKTQYQTYKIRYESNNEFYVIGKKGKEKEGQVKKIEIERERITEIKERQFSRLKTDLLTISAYAGAGVIIYTILTK